MADNYSNTFSQADGTPVTTSGINTEFTNIATGLAALSPSRTVRAPANETLSDFSAAAARAGEMAAFNIGGAIQDSPIAAQFADNPADMYAFRFNSGTISGSAGATDDLEFLGSIPSDLVSSGATVLTLDTSGIYLVILNVEISALTSTDANAVFTLDLISVNGSGTQQNLFARFKASPYSVAATSKAQPAGMAAVCWFNSGESLAVRASMDLGTWSGAYDSVFSPAAGGSEGVYSTIQRIGSKSLMG